MCLNKFTGNFYIYVKVVQHLYVSSYFNKFSLECMNLVYLYGVLIKIKFGGQFCKYIFNLFFQVLTQCLLMQIDAKRLIGRRFSDASVQIDAMLVVLWFAKEEISFMIFIKMR